MTRRHKNLGGLGASRRPGAMAACTCFNLRKASRVVTQIFEAALEPSGLKATQFTVLAVVSAAGTATMTDLARALVMDRTTLTRNLRPLENQGLIAIESGADRRTRFVALTGRGRAKLEAALPLWKEAQARMLKGLGRAAWRDLLEGLDAAVAVAQAPRSGAKDMAPG